ncbi:zinc finger BED domain-containing protein 5-like [Sipha flava]|uniref:Zinc finger BED domain-containing protein 5-like n=1 Tax=Sipha flava TaxID=143950 RepID=A0A8B8FA69_9HEMI|nr:zinc finger BED domain-containing protein 5-like [Sipha flava]
MSEENEGDSRSSKKGSTHVNKRRKFSEEYITFGFTNINVNNEERPQCVICYEILSNKSMKPAKLRRHLQTRHTDYLTKSKQFFESKAAELEQSKKLIKKTAIGTNNERAVTASYQVPLLVAKSGKPHTIVEELILPAAKIMVSAMLGDKASNELSTVSLSNNTVKNRIVEMSENIKEQLISNIKTSKFYSLQLDESTDICNDANLLAYVRYENHNTITEDFFILHISTFQYYREALAAKNMPEKLNEVLRDIVQVVNLIKARSLNSRIFNLICEDMGSIHKQLLLHAEVRWLSRVPDKNKNWVVDPFNADVPDITGLTTTQENQLIEISSNSNLKRVFKESSLSSFWLSIRQDYPEISDSALRPLMLFSTTYLCEKGFSAYVYTKNKYRNRLNIESDLRIQLSNIDPKIPDLVLKKQHHPSH